MAAIDIMRLGPEDAALHHAMQALYAAAFEDADAYLGAPPDHGHIRRALGSDLTIALVALDGDAVVGGLTAYELPKLEQARSEIYIYDLAVAAPHRRRGIATRLIDALRTVARSRGASVIYVQADPGDGPAVALYTKSGRREDVLHFDIPVS